MEGVRREGGSGRWPAAEPGRVVEWEREAPPGACDVVIIGGGMMGASTAYWLSHRLPRTLAVTLIDRDPTVRTACAWGRVCILCW